MHDPLVVAWQVHVPIPRRWSILPSSTAPRTGIVRRRFVNPEHAGQPIERWWLPRGWEVYVRGRRYVMREWVTVWHVEPGGRDSGEVCKHYVRWQDADGWHSTMRSAWRWHVHHWRVRFPGLHMLRRRLLTRCAWCGGRDRKGDPVNCSQQWDGPNGRWWRGEPDLFHSDCTSVSHAHKMCRCDPVAAGDPVGPGNHTCPACGKFRRYAGVGRESEFVTVEAIYASIPVGGRPTPTQRDTVKALAELGWAARRERERASS